MKDPRCQLTICCLAVTACLGACAGGHAGAAHDGASDLGAPIAAGGAAGPDSSMGGGGPGGGGPGGGGPGGGPGGNVSLPDAGMRADAGDGDGSGAPSADPVNWGPPFVAFGYRSARAYSMDGKAWTQAPDPAVLPAGWTGPPIDGDNQWLLRGGCWGQGKFLAVGGTGGDLGLMLSSTDGQAWSLVGGSQTNDDCAYGAGLWVTQIRWSSDGTNWTKLKVAGNSTRRMVYGDGLFVAAGDDNLSYTRDGQAWTELPITFVGTAAARKGYNRVAFGNHRFVALNTDVSGTPVLVWDGASDASFSETHPAELAGAPFIDLTYGRHAFYIGSTNAMYRLADGASQWQKISAPTAMSLYNLVVTDDLFFDDQRWSIDGAQWTKATNAPTDHITKIVGTPR